MIQRRDIKRDYMLSGKKRIDLNQNEGINILKEEQPEGILPATGNIKTGCS